MELDSLTIGQELECSIPTYSNLFSGKRGHKIFCECGVGRCRDGETWKMVFGMLRLDRKESAARKKLQRLKEKKSFTAYVSRLRPDNDEFEIVLTTDNIPQQQKQLVSLSSLRIGQEVIGTVNRVEPYGVLVQVQADNEGNAVFNRHGLLHIQKVADLFGTFINKEQGLKESGLGKGDKVRLQVASLKSKRLYLDFTDDVKAAAEQERQEAEQIREKNQAAQEVAAARSVPGLVASVNIEEEATMMIPSFEIDDNLKSIDNEGDAMDDNYDEDEDEDEYYDDDDEDYDEDRDIEDQLGLGTY